MIFNEISIINCKINNKLLNNLFTNMQINKFILNNNLIKKIDYNFMKNLDINNFNFELNDINEYNKLSIINITINSLKLKFLLNKFSWNVNKNILINFSINKLLKKQLKEIYLINFIIKKLTIHYFYEFNSLEIIYFENIRLYSISEKTFSSNNLKKIIIKNCPIKIISLKLLINNPQLEMITNDFR